MPRIKFLSRFTSYDTSYALLICTCHTEILPLKKFLETFLLNFIFNFYYKTNLLVHFIDCPLLLRQLVLDDLQYDIVIVCRLRRATYYSVLAFQLLMI